MSRAFLAIGTTGPHIDGIDVKGGVTYAIPLTGGVARLIVHPTRSANVEVKVLPIPPHVASKIQRADRTESAGGVCGVTQGHDIMSEELTEEIEALRKVSTPFRAFRAHPPQYPPLYPYHRHILSTRGSTCTQARS